MREVWLTCFGECSGFVRDRARAKIPPSVPRISGGGQMSGEISFKMCQYAE
jgi:hypothetical protein